jgi:hypothetical protein
MEKNHNHRTTTSIIQTEFLILFLLNFIISTIPEINVAREQQMVKIVAIKDKIFHDRGIGGATVVAAIPNEIKDIKQRIAVRFFFISLFHLSTG